MLERENREVRGWWVGRGARADGAVDLCQCRRHPPKQGVLREPEREEGRVLRGMPDEELEREGRARPSVRRA